MKAIVQDRYGTPGVLGLGEVGKPAVKGKQVLVRVHAAAVNPGDWAELTGVPYVVRLEAGPRRPRNGVRGMDLAGTVEAVGDGVTRFRPGDAVFGTGSGAFAEYAVAREDRLAPKPASLTFEQAAASPTSGLTALLALRDHGKVGPGQKVLVNGASGGIGTFAVQIAKALGAEVTGVCGAGKAERVRSLGADHVVDYTREDYTREDFTRRGERYDVILDNVSNHPLSRLRSVLTPTGTLIPNGGQFKEHPWMASLGRTLAALVLSPFVRHSLRPFVQMTKSTDLAALTELIESGQVTPVVDRVYPLSETPDAMRRFGEGHPTGKVVITAV